MAAVAVTFGRYFIDLTHVPLSDWMVAAVALALLTAINCLGVRAGSTVQSALMILKFIAIAALILCGLFLAGEPAPADSSKAAIQSLDPPISFDLLTSLGAAMVPVLFAYGGWQTANFIAAEVREPRKNLPRGLVIGVIGVIVPLPCRELCVCTSTGNLRTRPDPDAGLRRDETPLLERRARLLAAGIAISTLGF